MKDDKLKQLTEKLYNEGVSKAQEDADRIVKEANEKAEQIVKEAKEKAQKIEAESNKKAEDQKRQVENDLQRAAEQTLRTVKQKLEQLITAKVIEQPVKESFKDNEFVRKLIEKAIENWSPDKEQISLSVLLPQSMQQDLGKYLEQNAHKMLQAGLDVQFTSRIKGGFKIGPADGSYKISFEDRDFENLFESFLRPQTADLLFDEKA